MRAGRAPERAAPTQSTRAGKASRPARPPTPHGVPREISLAAGRGRLPSPARSTLLQRRTPVSGVASLSSLPVDFHKLFQAFHVGLAEDFGFDHATHQLLHRALAESIDD